YVLVTDAYGCDTVKSSDFYITSLDIQFYTDSLSCYGSDDGRIITEIIGGVSPYTYEWTNLDGDTLQVTDSSEYSSDTLSGLSRGYYIVNVTDGNTNSEKDTVYVSEPDSIRILDIQPDTLSAESASDGSIEITATGGNDTLFFEITNLDDDNFDTYTDTIVHGGEDTTHVFTDLIKGLYEITVYDENGCGYIVDTANVIHFNLTMDSEDITCYGDENGLAVALINGGTPPYEYDWGSGSNQDTLQTDTISDLNEGWYYVTVTDHYGFELMDSVYINEPDSIVTNAIIEDAYCNQQTLEEDVGSITMSPEGGDGGPYQYQWAANAETTSDSTLTGLDAGKYSVTVIDNSGCKKDTTIRIEGNPDYDIELSIDEEGDSICYGSRVTLYPDDVQTDADYLRWYPFEEDYTATEDFDTLSSNLYEDTEIYLQGRNEYCYTTDTIQYDLYPYLDLHIIEDDEEADGELAYLENVEEVDLNASAENQDDIPSSQITYSWEPGDHFVSISDLQATLSLNSLREAGIAKQDVWVIAEVDHGDETCVETDSIKIKIIPNVTPTDAFSPNGDGINDTWTIKDADNYDNLEVTIFNRWGVKVFNRKPYRNEEGVAWDGRNEKGKELPSGTYYYVIKTHEKGVDILSGTVTIIR
ncbi:MAG: gliding motility-associated C-terminal domain-containing protein, partial [Bacteroidales bacterium]